MEYGQLNIRQKSDGNLLLTYSWLTEKVCVRGLLCWVLFDDSFNYGLINKVKR